MNLFIYTSLDEPQRESLRQQAGDSHTITFRNELTVDRQESALRQADVLMGNPPADWLRDAPSLKFWQLDSAGFEQYRDLNLSIPVSNMGDFFAWPCAETIVAGIMALYRRIDELAVLQRQRRWVGGPLRPTMKLLHRQNVVILGTGTIGQAIHRILSGFECRIHRMARRNPEAELHSVEELMAVLPDTDLLVNTLPGTADRFVTAAMLDRLKPGGVFANVGRGNTVDESALIARLQSGHLGGAVLDVTETEPLPEQSPLWTLPNVMLTQHTAGGQQGEAEGKMAQFLRNLKRFETGQDLENRQNLRQGY